MHNRKRDLAMRFLAVSTCIKWGNRATSEGIDPRGDVGTRRHFQVCSAIMRDSRIAATEVLVPCNGLHIGLQKSVSIATTQRLSYVG